MAGARPTRGLRRTGGLRQSAPALADPINQEHAEHPEAFDPAAKNGALARAAAEVGTWLFPLLVCVVRAGLRIGEVLALRPEDLDLTTAGRETLRVARARTIDRAGRVVLDDPKTEAGRRTLRLSPAVVTVLRRWLDVDRPAWKLEGGGGPCRPGSSSRPSTPRPTPPTIRRLARSR
jgi:integrase